MNILFIEDDAMNRRVVRDMLLVGGAAMSEAADAESGLRMIDESEYDLVLLDLRMPDIDGWTALRRIRNRDDVKSSIPVVIITADTSVDLRERLMLLGADDLLLKPVAMQSLFDSIGRIMASRLDGGPMPI